MAHKMVYISLADAACCAKDMPASSPATVFAKVLRLLAMPFLALGDANRAARLRRQAREIPDHLRHDIGLKDLKEQSRLREGENVRFPNWT